jgi:hypothetical protein
MKNVKSSKSGINRYAFPLVLIAAIAAVGVSFLFSSRADTIRFLGFLNYQSQVTSAGVFVSQDSIPGSGTQNVTDIAPGYKMNYANYNAKNAIDQICYYARAYNSPKVATTATSANTSFAGIGHTITVPIPIDGHYYSICVSTGTSSTSSYNVWNHSSSAYVLVYQAIVYYKK